MGLIYCRNKLTTYTSDNLNDFRRCLGRGQHVLAAALLFTALAVAAPGAYAQASAADEIVLRDLLQQSEEGVPYARYRLGQMYADGQEIERDDLLALMWLGCAARDKDADVRRAAIRKRAEIEPRAGPVLAAMGWLLAELRCDSEKSGRSPYNPDREELPEKVFFFPGDMTMSASLNASESLGLTWLREHIWRTYTKLGNILVGLISILLWFLCIRGVIAIARTTDSTTGYSTWAWNRTPDEALTSTPLPRGVALARERKKEKKDKPSGG